MAAVAAPKICRKRGREKEKKGWGKEKREEKKTERGEKRKEQETEESKRERCIMDVKYPLGTVKKLYKT